MARPEMDTCIKEMDKIFQFNDGPDNRTALEMDVLTNRLQRLKLDNKIVTLLHELWDKMNKGGSHKVEITSERGGMVVLSRLRIRNSNFEIIETTLI